MSTKRTLAALLAAISLLFSSCAGESPDMTADGSTSYGETSDECTSDGGTSEESTSGEATSDDSEVKNKSENNRTRVRHDRRRAD